MIWLLKYWKGILVAAILATAFATGWMLVWMRRRLQFVVDLFAILIFATPFLTVALVLHNQGKSI